MPILNPIITNQYAYELPVFPYDGNAYTTTGLIDPLTVISPNSTAPAQSLGNPAEHILIKVPGIGDLVFINLEENVLERYQDAALKGKYGILIRYQKREIYLRYDLIFPYWQQGITIDSLGTLHLYLNDKDHAVPVKLGEASLV